MQPHVPAAPIKPNHFFDSDGLRIATVIPQNKTIGKITITSQTMYDIAKTNLDLNMDITTMRIKSVTDNPKVAICIAPNAWYLLHKNVENKAKTIDKEAAAMIIMEISAGSKYWRRKESEVARAVMELWATMKYKKQRRPILGPQLSFFKRFFKWGNKE